MSFFSVDKYDVMMKQSLKIELKYFCNLDLYAINFTSDGALASCHFAIFTCQWRMSIRQLIHAKHHSQLKKIVLRGMLFKCSDLFLYNLFR